MKVELGTLKNKGDDLVSFLEPRVGAKPSLSGDAIEIEDESLRSGVRPRHVKTYIKRFLYMNGLRKNYRVFVVGKELTIQEIELGEKEEGEKMEEVKKELEKAEAKEEPEAPEGPESPEKKMEEGEEEAAPEKPKKAAARKPRATKKKKAEE